MRTEMILRPILFCCFFVLTASTAPAQGNPLRDSLLMRLAPLAKDDTLRLAVLNGLAGATQDNQAEAHQYTDQLLQEAQQQQNNRYICEAYFLRVMMAYNSFDAEGVQSNFKLLAPLARKAKCYDLLFRGWRCSIDYLLFTQDYEQNEQEAKRMLAEAQELDNIIGQLEGAQCLANIYRTTYRKEKAAEVLQHALEVALTYKKHVAASNVWQMLLFLYQDGKVYPQWLEALNGFERFLKEGSPSDLGQTTQELMLVYTSYVEYYLQQDSLHPDDRQRENLKQARRYLDLAAAHYSDTYSVLYRIYYNKAGALYYSQAGEDRAALEKIDLALHDIEQQDMKVDRNRLLSLKSLVLCRSDRCSEALPLYKQVQAFKDSLEVVTINKQYEQLKKNFSADQLLLRQAQLQHHMQLYALALLAIGLLIVIYFVFYLKRSQHTLRQAEEQMRAMARQMEQANGVKDRFLSNIGSLIRQPLDLVVEGSLQLAEHKVEDPEECQRMASEIRTRSTLLLRLINSILDLSRLEAGMMKFEEREVEFSSLLLDAIGTACRGGRENECVHDIGDWGALYMGRGDSARLQQVFVSLFEATAPGCDHMLLRSRLEAMRLHIYVAGTILVQDDLTQEDTIRNEINRMLLKHFSGTYEVLSHQSPPCIHLSIPIVEVIYPEG